MYSFEGLPGPGIVGGEGGEKNAERILPVASHDNHGPAIVPNANSIIPDRHAISKLLRLFPRGFERSRFDLAVFFVIATSL
jgi:hypothetical protein